MIPVTKPFLPPLQEYQSYLENAWERNWLTNNGPHVQELEKRLKLMLGLKHLLFVSNGTVALQLAIKALDLRGEIITTPFSYVATTSSIVWEGCTPVFADIDPDTLNIDPISVEARISEKTTAILATHVFGNPCDIKSLTKIAKKHNLRIIYDAAHCFGSTYNGRSVLDYGDISTISFHATKLFHTVEGGAVTTRSQRTHHRISRMRNFGHDGPDRFTELGINGKNSEIHAAMGLTNLKYANALLSKRKSQHDHYLRLFEEIGLNTQSITPGSQSNGAYAPVIFKSEAEMMRVKSALESHDIYPRRYFYPSLGKLPYISCLHPTPISDNISRKIFCLPLFHDLTREQQDHIVFVIHGTLSNSKLLHSNRVATT